MPQLNRWLFALLFAAAFFTVGSLEANFTSLNPGANIVYNITFLLIVLIFFYKGYFLYKEFEFINDELLLNLEVKIDVPKLNSYENFFILVLLTISPLGIWGVLLGFVLFIILYLILIYSLGIFTLGRFNAEEFHLFDRQPWQFLKAENFKNLAPALYFVPLFLGLSWFASTKDLIQFIPEFVPLRPEVSKGLGAIITWSCLSQLFSFAVPFEFKNEICLHYKNIVAKEYAKREMQILAKNEWMAKENQIAKSIKEKNEWMDGKKVLNLKLDSFSEDFKIEFDTLKVKLEAENKIKILDAELKELLDSNSRKLDKKIDNFTLLISKMSENDCIEICDKVADFFTRERLTLTYLNTLIESLKDCSGVQNEMIYINLFQKLDNIEELNNYKLDSIKSALFSITNLIKSNHLINFKSIKSFDQFLFEFDNIIASNLAYEENFQIELEYIKSLRFQLVNYEGVYTNWKNEIYGDYSDLGTYSFRTDPYFEILTELKKSSIVRFELIKVQKQAKINQIKESIIFQIEEVNQEKQKYNDEVKYPLTRFYYDLIKSTFAKIDLSSGLTDESNYNKICITGLGEKYDEKSLNYLHLIDYYWERDFLIFKFLYPTTIQVDKYKGFASYLETTIQRAIKQIKITQIVDLKNIDQKSSNDEVTIKPKINFNEFVDIIYKDRKNTTIDPFSGYKLKNLYEDDNFNGLEFITGEYLSKYFDIYNLKLLKLQILKDDDAFLEIRIMDNILKKNIDEISYSLTSLDSSSKDGKLAVGRDEITKNIVTIDFQDKNPQILITGGPRMGKGMLVVCILDQLINNYTSDEVRIFIIEHSSGGLINNLIEDTTNGLPENIVHYEKIDNAFDFLAYVGKIKQFYDTEYTRIASLWAQTRSTEIKEYNNSILRESLGLPKLSYYFFFFEEFGKYKHGESESKKEDLFILDAKYNSAMKELETMMKSLAKYGFNFIFSTQTDSDLKINPQFGYEFVFKGGLSGFAADVADHKRIKANEILPYTAVLIDNSQNSNVTIKTAWSKENKEFEKRLEIAISRKDLVKHQKLIEQFNYFKIYQSQLTDNEIVPAITNKYSQHKSKPAEEI